MSSLVQAKWTNSRRLGELAVAGDVLLDEVFDGLDVVVRRALDRLDARGVVLGEIVGELFERRCAQPARTRATSAMPASSASASSQRTSTSTRRFMRPYSLKIGRSVLDLGGVAAVERRQGGERAQGHRVRHSWAETIGSLHRAAIIADPAFHLLSRQQ